MTASNEVTGSAYKGGNILRLLGAEAEHNYDPAHGWAGFKQWLDAGRVVRKGEHGTACITVVSVADDKGKPGKRPRGFRVFHYDQTVELGAEQVADDAPGAPVVDVDAMVATLVIAPSPVALAQAADDHRELSDRARRFGMVRDPGEDMADRWAESH